VAAWSGRCDGTRRHVRRPLLIAAIRVTVRLVASDSGPALGGRFQHGLVGLSLLTRGAGQQAAQHDRPPARRTSPRAATGRSPRPTQGLLERSGMSPEEEARYWADLHVFLDNLQPDRFPAMARVRPYMAGHGDRERFEFGLDTMLAGLEALSDAERSGTG
jgi:Tetracyclin repressor-like, C-terminal domain